MRWCQSLQFSPATSRSDKPAPAIRPSRTGPPLHLDKRTNKTAITIGGIKKKTMKLVSPMTMPAPTSAQSQKPTQPMR